MKIFGLCLRSHLLDHSKSHKGRTYELWVKGEWKNSITNFRRIISLPKDGVTTDTFSSLHASFPRDALSLPSNTCAEKLRIPHAVSRWRSAGRPRRRASSTRQLKSEQTIRCTFLSLSLYIYILRTLFTVFFFFLFSSSSLIGPRESLALRSCWGLYTRRAFHKINLRTTCCRTSHSKPRHPHSSLLAYLNASHFFRVYVFSFS